MSSPPPFTIRHAVPTDGKIVRAFVTATLWTYALDENHDDLIAFAVPFNGALAELVADVDGVAVGMVTLYPRGKRTGWISKLFVDPEHRGKGIGKALLDAVIAEARTWKLDRLGLSTLPMLREAVHLYESTGWVRRKDPRTGRTSDRVYWLKL